MPFTDKLEGLVNQQNQTLSQLNRTLSGLGGRVTSSISPAVGSVGFAGMNQLQTGAMSAAQGMMGSSTMLGGAGSAMTGMGHAADLFGPYGQAAGGVAKFAGEMTKSVEYLQSWDRALLDSKFKMSEVSPAMAIAEVEQELRDITYEMRMGEQLAGPTADLGEAFSVMRDETSALEKEWLKLRFRFTTGMARVFHFYNPETFGENLLTTPEFTEMWKRTGTGRGQHGLAGIPSQDDGSAKMRDEDFFQFYARPQRFPREILNRPAARP